MEQIRIVKEMRENDIRNGWADELIRPRFMVWENVPGALSSNKGEDFRIVLEEITRVKDKDAVVPRPENGKWNTCGCIVGNGYSICWRVLDAQYWGISYFGDDGVPTKLGTPQRRRRIALVADFNTEWGAGEVLLEREGLPRNNQTRSKEGQRIADSSERGLVESNTNAYGVQIGELIRRDQKITPELAPTLRAESNSGDNAPRVISTVDSFAEVRYGQYNQDQKSSALKASGGSLDGGSETLVTDRTIDSN